MQVNARMGQAWQARQGTAWIGRDGNGQAGLVTHGEARTGKDGLGAAGKARRVTHRIGVARQAWTGNAGTGWVDLGQADRGRPGMAWTGVACTGVAGGDRKGLVNHGMVWRGAAGMALAVRVIPVMLTRGRMLVKGKQFDNSRVVGHAAQAARIHAARGVDELLLIDVAATKEGRGPDLSLVEELSREIFIPVTVGGGVRSINDIRALLRAGADKVLVGERFREPGGDRFLQEASAMFGSQAIVVSIDHPRQAENDARRAATLGAGELIVNDMERDGTMSGYNLKMISEVARLSIPVIACGGCGSYQHMVEAVLAGASAVAAGALFQFEDATPMQAAAYLKSNGIHTRITA